MHWDMTHKSDCQAEQYNFKYPLLSSKDTHEMLIQQLCVGCSSVYTQCSVYHPLTWISTECSSLSSSTYPDSHNPMGPLLPLGLGNQDTSCRACITNLSSPTWVLRLPWLFLGRQSLVSTLDSPTASAGSNFYLLVCPVNRLGSFILNLFIPDWEYCFFFLTLLTFFRKGIKYINIILFSHKRVFWDLWNKE